MRNLDAWPTLCWGHRKCQGLARRDVNSPTAPQTNSPTELLEKSVSLASQPLQSGGALCGPHPTLEQALTVERNHCVGQRHLHQEGSPKQTQETSSPIIASPAVLTPALLVEPVLGWNQRTCSRFV